MKEALAVQVRLLPPVAIQIVFSGEGNRAIWFFPVPRG